MAGNLGAVLAGSVSGMGVFRQVAPLRLTSCLAVTDLRPLPVWVDRWTIVAAAELERQPHLFQEFNVAWVLAQAFEQRIDLEVDQARVVLLVGAIEPL